MEKKEMKRAKECSAKWEDERKAPRRRWQLGQKQKEEARHADVGGKRTRAFWVLRMEKRRKRPSEQARAGAVVRAAEPRFCRAMSRTFSSELGGKPGGFRVWVSPESHLTQLWQLFCEWTERRQRAVLPVWVAEGWFFFIFFLLLVSGIQYDGETFI